MKTGLDEKIRGEVKTIKPSLIEEVLYKMMLEW
jgi:hypothetical protein